MKTDDLVKSLKSYVEEDDVNLGRIAFLITVANRIREDIYDYIIATHDIEIDENETHSKS